MPAVDRDAMPPAQRASWDRLWRVLLAPEPTKEETHAAGSLQTDGDAGATADSKKLTTNGNDATERSGRDG